jgi:hypothetical protein
MRLLAVAAAFTLSSCSLGGSGVGSGSGTQTVTVNVNVRPDSVVKAAIAYLNNNGFTATRLADSTLVTAPRAVPERARTASTQDQQWVLQIRSEKMFLMTGSRLRVTGFVVPPASNMPVDTMTVRAATPITNRNPLLFNEVQSVANAIAASLGKGKS